MNVRKSYNSITNVVGFYCTYCGKFLKWANKDEKNLIKINSQERGDE